MLIIHHLIFLYTIISVCNGARILGIFHVPSKSHHILASPLLRNLAAKGHDVTMVSPYPFKNPIKNYRDIFLDTMEQFKEENMRKFMKPDSNPIKQFLAGVKLFDTLNDELLSHKDVQALKKEKFDLIIQFAMGTDVLLGLADHFNASVIYFNTVGSVYQINSIFGNPAPPSFVPSMLVTSASEMTFLQRVLNTIASIAFGPLFTAMINYNQEELYRKYFPDAPPIDQLIQDRIALAFVNSHFSIESPRPYLPNIVQVGGIQIEDPKELPKDLKEYLDSAKEGAIFFSLGSNVRFTDFPKNKVDAILTTLGKLKQKVLFKTNEKFANTSANIKFSKWLPQNDVLAHPNVKLFISHGGLLSTTEAVYHGVPTIGMPIFGDQKFNVDDSVSKGYALKLLVDDLTEESFSNTIQEILQNPKYKENVKLRSALLKEQPIKPLDLAIFWVEHVLKHKGANHLKNGGAKLTWYQYHLLDVYLFLFAMTSIIILISYAVIRKLCRILISACCQKQKMKKS